MTDYAGLMKRVEEVVDSRRRGQDEARTLAAIAGQVVRDFRDELGLRGGRLYRRRGGAYALLTTFGEAKPVEGPVEVPAGYGPLVELLLRGTVFMRADAPGSDPELERRLGVEEFAAVSVGDDEFLLSFDVAPGAEPSGILFSLGILRHSLSQRLRQKRIEGSLREARRIQSSILPRRAPEFGPFDVFGRTEPIEEVGGDFFDYIAITDKIQGVALADVSGHGLPAALQVRDIYTGLRMGLSRDFKIVRTVERLNSIIHESTLTSRFVAMFYGELDLNGVFLYVNAGHVPPLYLAADGTAHQLVEGGAVLGPIPDAQYERGYLHLRPGELIVLYTDGIVETEGAGGEEYGVGRLLATLARRGDATSEEIVSRIFEDVAAYSGGREAQDDRTVVAIRYPG